MSSFNSVTLMGNLGKDPELRHTQNQKAVCNFSMAMTDKFGGSDRTIWMNVTAWDKTAENCAKYLKKGSSALVHGRLDTRSYDDKDGKKVHVVEVVAQNVQFISSPGERPQQAPAPGASFEEPPF